VAGLGRGANRAPLCGELILGDGGGRDSPLEELHGGARHVGRCASEGAGDEVAGAREGVGEERAT
jgi:hypothetical protein